MHAMESMVEDGLNEVTRIYRYLKHGYTVQILDKHTDVRCTLRLLSKKGLCLDTLQHCRTTTGIGKCLSGRTRYA